MNSSWRKCLENIVFNSEITLLSKFDIHYLFVLRALHLSKNSSWWRRTEGVLKTTSRSPQGNIFLSSKTKHLEDVFQDSWKRLEDVLGRRIANTSWRRLGRRKVLRWRRLGKQEMFAGIKSKLRNLWLPSR